MMVRRLRVPWVLASVTAMVGALVVSTAAPAAAATIDVSPGQSIQAAINSASPGDTIVVAPGTYKENLEINTDNLTLEGAGGAPGGTVLKPPTASAANHNGCFVSNKDFDGICVTGTDPASGTATVPVTGVTIMGFQVSGFSGIGIHVFGGYGVTVNQNVLVNNGIDGVASLDGGGNTISGNRASGSAQAGFLWGDSPLVPLVNPTTTNATMKDNSSFGNGAGFFTRNFHDPSTFFDSNDPFTEKSLLNNDAEGNCIGILSVSTMPRYPNGTLNATGILGNTVIANNRTCPPSTLLPVIVSGTGIGSFGTLDDTVENNTVRDNVPSGTLPYSGGIVLAGYPGGVPFFIGAYGYNTAYGDQPFDFRYDGSGAKINHPISFAFGLFVFYNNCDTSSPTSAPLGPFTPKPSGFGPICRSLPAAQSPAYPGYGPGA